MWGRHKVYGARRVLHTDKMHFMSSYPREAADATMSKCLEPRITCRSYNQWVYAHLSKQVTRGNRVTWVIRDCGQSLCRRSVITFLASPWDADSFSFSFDCVSAWSRRGRERTGREEPSLAEEICLAVKTYFFWFQSQSDFGWNHFEYGNASLWAVLHTYEHEISM